MQCIRFSQIRGLWLYLRNILITEHLDCVTKHLHIIPIDIVANARDEKYLEMESHGSILQQYTLHFFVICKLSFLQFFFLKVPKI